MKWLEVFGLGSKRREWQELVGSRPHAIDEQNATAGYGKRQDYEVVDRIALVDVRGMLVDDADWWDGWGRSTYDRIAGEVRGAAEDPEVDAILLRVNSPGGETTKMFETAAAIVAAGKQKPVWAVADTAAFSAAYLLASSAARLYIAPYSGGVGSIGVYTVHLDYSGYLRKAGVEPTFIEAGKGKTDGHPYKPLSQAAEARVKKQIDRLYGLFVDHVAAQRDLTAGGLRELGAAVLTGSEAIDEGLADKVGDTVIALQELRAHLDASKPAFAFPVAAAAAADSKKEATMPPDVELKADAQTAAAPTAPVPSVTDSVVEDRRAKARIESILALCASFSLGAVEVQKFIADGMTPEAVQTLISERRVSESAKTEVISQIEPQSGTSAKYDPKNSPLVQAAEAEAERHAKARKEK